MNNIFKKAYFGKKYKTKDGEECKFIQFSFNEDRTIEGAYVWFPKRQETKLYDLSGIYDVISDDEKYESGLDLVDVDNLLPNQERVCQTEFGLERYLTSKEIQYVHEYVDGQNCHCYPNGGDYCLGISNIDETGIIVYVKDSYYDLNDTTYSTITWDELREFIKAKEGI